MEHEKKYKEALERASKLRVQNPFDTVGQMVEHIFPELREPEDESIRKFIKEQLYKIRSTVVYNSNLDIELANAIAWIEKKDEKNAEKKLKTLEDNEPKFKVGDWIVDKSGLAQQVLDFKSGIYTCTYNNFTTGCESNYRLWEITDARDGDLIYVSTEEKGIQAIFHEYKNDTIFFHCYLCADFVQGGYMPIGSVELTYPLQKTHYNRFFEKMHEAGWEWDQKKAKLIKMKETKFKVGDWVVKQNSESFWNGDYVTQITNITDCGRHWLNIGCWVNAGDIRLWTIQDAKDGDVLTTDNGNCPFIYRTKTIFGNPVAYCGVRSDGLFISESPENHQWCLKSEVIPATKEQRNLFFAKMKEADWERIVKIKN